MYNIYNVAGLLDSLAQSPSEAVLLDLLWEGMGVLLVNRQSVALWEEGVRNSLCLFTGTPCDGVFSLDFPLQLVIPLAFSDIALVHLRETLLILGGSGIEVLLICALHWSLFTAKVLCWVSKLLVTALPCCSLTA